MRWLFHFGEFSVSNHLLHEARQRCRGIFVADAHRGDGKRYVLHSDDKLTAFLQLESAIRNIHPDHNAAPISIIKVGKKGKL